MKKIIYKTNQYLLENYPIIWNTKIVWALLISFILHIVFFILGFIALTNPKLLHDHNAKSIFFNNGTVFISIILSILLIVIWLIFLFKNNAFKSFYPTTKQKLFKQFICYLIIVFCSTTFFLSYNFGLKSYIDFKYKDEKVKKDISVSNDAALFFSKKLEDYTINKRRYPKPFDTLYCEVNSNLELDSIKPYLKFLNYKYRFYTLYTRQGALNQVQIDPTYSGFVFVKTKDSIRTFYYKDSIFDVSPFVKSAYPSYYNFSETFYKSRSEKLGENYIDYDYNQYDNYDEYGLYPSDNFAKEHELRNKKNSELLKRNNPKEIKKLLSDFLAISNQFEIDHNLTPEKWFDLIYNPEDFELKWIIRNEPKTEYLYETKTAKNPSDGFYKEHMTDYYFNDDELRNVFENIEEIKASTPYLESIHFFIWFSFFFSAIIYMFRITGLKPLLFTAISVGVITLTIILLTVFYGYTIDFNGNSVGYFISYLTLIVGAFILIVPMFLSKIFKKLFVAICLNISIFAFILYVFLILTTITMHQNDKCIQNKIPVLFNDCPTVLNTLGVYWSFVLFIINLIFIYFYSNTIKNWKALPEG